MYHANGFVAHNCRCYAQYFVVGPNGERLEIGLQTPALPARRRWHAGDRPGIETPVLPTSRVALSGRTNARVVLGDGRTFANLRQVTPTTLVVRVGGRDVARAEIANGAVSRMVIAPGHEHLDIDGLIRRSVVGR